MTKRKDTPVEDWITTKTAADQLGVHYTYVEKLIAAGVFEGRKVTSRLWLVNRASLANWTRKRKRGGDTSK